MEEEISFHEFSDFYKKVIDELNSNHESYDEEAVWKVLFIVENVMSNADGRVKESKGSESKKYQKNGSTSPALVEKPCCSPRKGRLYGRGYY